MLDAAVLLAAAAATPFNPPLGVPLAYMSSEDRTIDGKTLHFESRRSITGGGTARVTITRDRAIDPETGLVLAFHDHRITTIGGDRATADTEVTLTVPVSKYPLAIPRIALTLPARSTIGRAFAPLLVGRRCSFQTQA